MYRLVLFSMLFLLWSPQSLEAQEQITVGTRVRIKAPSISKRRLVGSIVTLSADSLFLKLKKKTIPLAIPLASVTRLEMSRGKKRNIGKGALYGFLGGAVLGAVFGNVRCGRPVADCVGCEQCIGTEKTEAGNGTAGVG